MLETRPETRVDGVTAAVTAGPAPAIVIDVALTAVTVPTRKSVAAPPPGSTPLPCPLPCPGPPGPAELPGAR